MTRAALSGEEAAGGREVYRVDWVPGTDLLHGVCHCGAEHTARDPVAMWEWMLGHPEGHVDGHRAGATGAASDGTSDGVASEAARGAVGRNAGGAADE